MDRKLRMTKSHLHSFVAVFGAIYLACGVAYAADIAWKSDVASGTWSEGSNWEGGVAPGVGDTAVFNNAAIMTLTEEATVSAMTVNAEVTLRGKDKRLRAASVTSNAAGKIIVAESLKLAGTANAADDCTWNVPIQIETGVKCTAHGGNHHLILSGSLLGSGELYCDKGDNYCSVKLAGDNKDFKGRVTVGSNNNNRMAFTAATAGSEDALFYIEGNATDNGSFYFGSETIHFGAFQTEKDAKIRTGNDNKSIVEIGAKSGMDSEIKGATFNQGNASGATTCLRKVGADTTLKLNANNYTTLEVNAGVVAVTGGAVPTSKLSFGGGTLRYDTDSFDPSAKISDSSSPMEIDTNGRNITYASGIGSSNTGGLVKKGAGTLDVSAAASSYSGKTIVSNGTLKVRFNTAQYLPGEYEVEDGGHLDLTLYRYGAGNTRLDAGMLSSIPKGTTLNLDLEKSNYYFIRLGDISAETFTGTINFINTVVPQNAEGIVDTSLTEAGCDDISWGVLGNPAEGTAALIKFEIKNNANSVVKLGEFRLPNATAGVHCSNQLKLKIGALENGASVLNGWLGGTAVKKINKVGATSSLEIGTGFKMADNAECRLDIDEGTLIVNTDLTSSQTITTGSFSLDVAPGVKLAGAGKVKSTDFANAGNYVVKAVDNAPLTVDGQVDLSSIAFDVDFSGVEQGNKYVLLNAGSFTGSANIDLSTLNTAEVLKKGHWKVSASGGKLVLKYVKNAFMIIVR